MTLNHANATATVTLDGLAVCCFNKAQLRWEVAFLQQPEHDLMLSISEGVNVIFPRTRVDPTSSIKIYPLDGVTPDYQDAFKDGFFDNGPVNRKVDPVTPAEIENFRWALDMEDTNELPHGNVALKKPPTRATLTTILDAVFYTSEVTPNTPNDFFILPEGVDPNSLSPSELSAYQLGKVNDQVSADITCKEGGKVVVEVDKSRIVLDAKPGVNYMIDLNNMRRHHNHKHSTIFEKVDFSLYYDAMDVDSKLAMWGIPPNFHSGRVSCNIVRMGVTEDLSLLAS